MRRHARTDANHADIVKALRQCGCTVQSLASLGHGVPDLLVAPKHGPMLLMEIKDGSQPPSKQKLTPDEAEWHDKWNTRVHKITSVTDALSAVGVGE